MFRLEQCRSAAARSSHRDTKACGLSPRQGVAWFAVLSITWPVLETSWPAPATVWQAPRSGAIPKNVSRTRLESVILLDMIFTLRSGFGAGPAKPLVFDAGCWGLGHLAPLVN